VSSPADRPATPLYGNIVEHTRGHSELKTHQKKSSFCDRIAYRSLGYRRVVAAVEFLSENPSLFFEFSLCLSRACLGKMIICSIRWREDGVFLPASGHVAELTAMSRGRTGMVSQVRSRSVNAVIVAGSNEVRRARSLRHTDRDRDRDRDRFFRLRYYRLSRTYEGGQGGERKGRGSNTHARTRALVGLASTHFQCLPRIEKRRICHRALDVAESRHARPPATVAGIDPVGVTACVVHRGNL
jgi:hypothetical protein